MSLNQGLYVLYALDSLLFVCFNLKLNFKYKLSQYDTEIDTERNISHGAEIRTRAFILKFTS